MGRKERLKLALDISGIFLIITNAVSLICIIISSIYSFKLYETGLPCFDFGIPIIMLIIGIILFYIGKCYTLDKGKITDVNLLKYTILGALLILIALEVIISQSISFFNMYNIAPTDFNNSIYGYCKTQSIVNIIGYLIQLVFGLFLIIKFNRKTNKTINDVTSNKFVQKSFFRSFKNSIKDKQIVVMIIFSILNWMAILSIFISYHSKQHFGILPALFWMFLGLFYYVSFIFGSLNIIIDLILLFRKNINLFLGIIIIIVNIVFFIWGRPFYESIFWMT